MNKNYTLKELADMFAYKRREALADGQSIEEARMLALRHVLSAIGYEFPKDEEREAFERWQKSHTVDPNDAFFDVWKAGRDELRRAQSLDKQPTKPAWIPWNGGECPLPDGVEFEFKRRDGLLSGKMRNDGYFRWKHLIQPDDIVAYRVIE